MADFVPPPKNSASPFADMKGHHVAVRVPDRATAVAWYVEKLDFRVIAEWPYADEDLAYVAPATDDHFYVEILGGGEYKPEEVRYIVERLCSVANKPINDTADRLAGGGQQPPLVRTARVGRIDAESAAQIIERGAGSASREAIVAVGRRGK